MSERVYRLGRGPWQCNRVGFGVCQAAGSPIIQPINGVLEREMRWRHMFTLFVHCLWVWKRRTDVVSGSTDLEGVHGSVIALDLEFTRRLLDHQ